MNVRLIREIELITNLISPPIPEDSLFLSELDLEEKKKEMIRSYIISTHLLSETFLTMRMQDFFEGSSQNSMRKIAVEALLNKISYKEKVEIAYKAELTSNEINKFLLELNKLRNYCAHRWIPGDEQINLIYEGKDLLQIVTFKKFFQKSKEVLYGAYPGFAEITKN